MKKITLLAFLLGAALCASAATPISKTELQATRSNGLVPQAIEVQHVSGAKAAISVATTWDFEDAEQFAQFTLVDSDGDGFNWQYYNNTGLETNRMNAHSGEGLIASASYDMDALSALHPDNWLISPEVVLGGALNFWARGQDPSYASEVFGVFVCVGDPSDLSNFVQIGSDVTATGEYVEYEFDLSAFAGQTGYFAIRHYNISDMFFLNIDDITYSPVPSPGLPTNLEVEPASTTAEVSWTPGNNNVASNLRYREWVDPAECALLYDLTDDNYEELIEDWSFVDNDGDGYNWGTKSYVDENGENVAFWSTSWMSGGVGALTPDNWLISPTFKLGGSFKFQAKNISSIFRENLRVYLCTNPNWTSVDEFIPISDDFEPGAGSTLQVYEYDLSQYEGEGCFAIRHYNCTDQYQGVLVDNIEIIPGDAKQPGEWIVVEDVESPYTIDGLTPETTYEVQVQGVNRARAEGDAVSAWTESVIFTTLAAGQEDPVFYVVGDFNSWSKEEGLVEIGEEGATITVDAEGLEFKLITPDVADGEDWIYLGGADDNGVNHFAITEELLGGEISLETPGANFRLPEAGTYTIKLIMVPLKAQVEGLKMIVTKENVTAIETINSEVKGDNNYYNLMGQKMNGNNLPAGIYIHNGKKVVVK